jgi:hypothetical protein
MTVAAVQPDLEQPPLVAELDYLRALLELSVDGGANVPPEPEPPQREPAIDRLARLFGLSPFERRLLLLAAAVELDGKIAALVQGLQQTPGARPTFGLALSTLPHAHWDALAPARPLRRWRLLELGSGPTLATRPLGIDERILHFLTGIEGPDERLEGVVHTLSPRPLAASQRRLARELARAAAAAGTRVLVRIDGEDSEARLAVAGVLAAELGCAAVVVRAVALPPPGAELAALARNVDREAILTGGLPVVVDGDGDAAAFVEELEAAVVIVAGDGRTTAGGRVTLHRSVDLPSPAERRALWAGALGRRVAAEVVEEVAQHFRLGAATIEAIARELATANGDAAGALRKLCRERARVRLEDLAERIDPVATWDDLVLPPGNLELLHEIARHVRHRTQVYERWGFGEKSSRGLGVTALFVGESGTGKTLAAEVLAADLALDLYRIDLAATVSKYIGETEKNLRRVFEAAEASGAVLLFDEADALFGKRGDVKDSVDRYANLEVAYLLQRMESYRGLAILTTNLRSSVDRAFLRRLRFVVQFPFPDAEQRAGIWGRSFPAAAPVDGIVPERLAQLTVSGGSIRSIALSAAFAAAEEGTPITPAHVLRAAQVDYAKSERALTDAETEGLR